MRTEKSCIITKEEMESIGKLPPGKGHWVRKKMHCLSVDETLFVNRMEWNWANKTPNVIVTDENAKGPKRFEFSEAANGQGWFIERLE